MDARVATRRAIALAEKAIEAGIFAQCNGTPAAENVADFIETLAERLKKLED